MRAVEVAAVVALLGLVGLHAAAPIACTDFFWHLKLGQIITAEGRIPTTDTFSAVWPNSPYVQPQWLWEWGAAQVYAGFGFQGIRVAQAVLLVTSFAGLYTVVRRITGRPSAAYLAAWLALALFEDRFRARPDAMTLGFVVLSLPLFFERTRWPGRALMAYALLLSLLWGNMHGGAGLLLLLSLAALAVGALFDRGLPDAEVGVVRRQLTLLGVASLGLVCSPTLVPGLLHWASLIGAQLQTGNEEWMPTYTALRQGVTPATILIATAPTLVAGAYVCEQVQWTRKVGRTPGALGEWLLCGGYLVLSQQAIRNVFLCIVPVVFMLGRRRDRTPAALNPALIAASCLVAVITLEDVVGRSYGGVAHARDVFSYDLLPDTYPEEAANFLAEAQIEGGIFNDGKWGGYLIFRAWPGAHVVVDSRQNLNQEMWQVFLATLSVRLRPVALDEAVRRWGVELAVFRGPTFALAAAPPRWQLLYKAGDQEVYQHLAGAHAAQNVARARAWLSAHGAATGEDLTLAAGRVGAEHFLSARYQARKLDQARRQSTSGGGTQRKAALVTLGETYYRAGLYGQALAAFSAAQGLGSLDARTLYLDAFCSHATGDVPRLQTKLAQLARLDVAGLSRRQQERLALLREVAAER